MYLIRFGAKTSKITSLTKNGTGNKQALTLFPLLPEIGTDCSKHLFFLNSRSPEIEPLDALVIIKVVTR